MVVRVRELGAYADERGNRIVYAGHSDRDIQIKFTGSDNVLTIDPGARLNRLFVDFDCDGGRVDLGGSDGPRLAANIRVGERGAVSIGHNVSSTAPVVISAAEATTVRVGDDVMFSTANQVRADDAHPIFDVHTGQRVNVSRSITIGDHVWLAHSAVVLGGVTIGDGTVIGLGSVVNRDVPNNVIAAGVPARVVRRDVAWERPHLTMAEPFMKPDASTVEKSPFWNLTDDDPLPLPQSRWQRVLDWLQRRSIRPLY